VAIIGEIVNAHLEPEHHVIFNKNQLLGLVMWLQRFQINLMKSCILILIAIEEYVAQLTIIIMPIRSRADIAAICKNAELAGELWVIWEIATLSAPMNEHMEFVQNMTTLQATSRFAHEVSDGSRSLSHSQAIGASGGNLHCIGVCIRIYHSGEFLRHPLQWVLMMEASCVHY
jgi:hypothetical protein